MLKGVFMKPSSVVKAVQQHSFNKEPKVDAWKRPLRFQKHEALSYHQSLSSVI